jgi:hypothetical protein
MGYAFEKPEEALPGPGPESDAAISRLTTEIGAMPRSLDLFYRIVGSVNFVGHHPDWQGCEYPDPVVVFPVSAALDELEDYLYDREAYDAACGSFRVPVAPDYYHKENVSGGMWYGIAMPDPAEDPPLLEERHQTTFLSYLDICVDWAGFPGLELYADHHNWPVDTLKHGMTGS